MPNVSGRLPPGCNAAKIVPARPTKIPDPSASNKRNLNVELTRGTCVKTIPFVAVQLGNGGWLVESLDLNAAGNPVNPCPAPAGAAAPPGGN